MLDTATKRRIDSARQILVGKVPDPKTQVEQITTALVYKFMDDMDKKSQELGGKVKFFHGDFKKYGWTMLMDRRLSGQERFDLYVEAITKMSDNQNIGQFFRDIFKDAFLPYRDSRTLSDFLKEINGFTYDHSENLGNAFEYLLSVLGSQGDAGQFRTPRHIIDFIVEVVDPKKDETILDPACGTAGFLISAFKHIQKHNSSDFKPEAGGQVSGKDANNEVAYRGDLLTPSEKTKLMKNFVGYDISPDMVKLSLVNMYLHDFKDPKIHEYDTLTSERHWGRQFDVIMANPPFMTPKGGIRPHNRFSVQANRSEVLFVDYIIEHLTMAGRAGIIVPEGIIFRTEKSYKQLRQTLVNDGLYAVVSLPKGVFNPYSGVKTCILLFDNQFSGTVEDILFIKIENDGFDLGAKRQRIGENDLPDALDVLKQWKTGKRKRCSLAFWVKKKKILSADDYNLTGELYREARISKNSKWPLAKLSDVVTLSRGHGLSKKVIGDKGANKCIHYGQLYTTYSQVISNVRSYTDKEGKVLSVYGDVLVPGTTTADAFGIATASALLEDNVIVGGDINILRPDKSRVDSVYLSYLLSGPLKESLASYARGANIIHLLGRDILKIKIPLPPLAMQKELVEQIVVKETAISHAKEVIRSLERERDYFGQGVKEMKKVKDVSLGEVCEVRRGRTITKKQTSAGNIPVIAGGQQPAYYHDKANRDAPVITVSGSGAYAGFVNFFDVPIYASDCSTIQLLSQCKGVADIRYIFRMLKSIQKEIYQLQQGGGQPHVYPKDLAKIKVPLPPLNIQTKLVAEAEKEEKIIESNRLLVDLMKRRIDKIISTL